MNQKIKLAFSSIAVVVLGAIVIIYGQVIIQKFQQPKEVEMVDDPEDEVFEDPTSNDRLQMLESMQEAEQRAVSSVEDVVEPVDHTNVLNEMTPREESVITTEDRMKILNAM